MVDVRRSASPRRARLLGVISCAFVVAAAMLTSVTPASAAGLTPLNKNLLVNPGAEAGPDRRTLDPPAGHTG